MKPFNLEQRSAEIDATLLRKRKGRRKMLAATIAVCERQQNVNEEMTKMLELLQQQIMNIRADMALMLAPEPKGETF